MTIEERLRAMLLADGAFTALSANVFADEAPQNQAAPYVVYSLIAVEEQLSTHDDANSNTCVRRYQFSTVARHMIQCEQITDAIRAALISGVDATGQVQAILPGIETRHKDIETQLFFRTLDLLVVANRA